LKCPPTKGYDLLKDITPLLIGRSIEDVTPISSLTFATDEVCPNECGPTEAYVDVIVNGLAERKAEPSYAERIDELRPARSATE
jgi:hypothetical protein